MSVSQARTFARRGVRHATSSMRLQGCREGNVGRPTSFLELACARTKFVARGRRLDAARAARLTKR